MRKLLIGLPVCATLFAAGCAVHELPVQQGNVIEEENVARLETGMTRSQVRFLLGTPLIQDPFHPDRWDYVHSLQTGGELQEQKRVTVFFEDDALVRVEKYGLDTPAADETSTDD